jgi:hypothetical protein
MLRQKFFDPPIDVAGHLRAYDPDILAPLAKRLGLSDVWVTASWGFSDATEREDIAFLRSKLPNFHQQHLRTHAYVQGLNAVQADHPTDLWCRDRDGRTIPYHRGRALTCPLNPAARALLIRRVGEAAQLEVDGVFVDNFSFGRFPFPMGNVTPFFGCACTHCDAAFRRFAHAEIPHWHALDGAVSLAYLAFRRQTMAELARELAAVTHAQGKLYGANGFDLDLDPPLFYGYALPDLQAVQDYLLVENFNHPARKRSNVHLRAFAAASAIPLCVVSYRDVIGRHAAPTQADLEAIANDAAHSGVTPIFKGTEYTTRGQWHTLDPQAIQPLGQARPSMPMPPWQHRRRPVAQQLAARLQTRVQRWTYESRFGRWLGSRFVDALTRRAGHLAFQAHERTWLLPTPPHPAGVTQHVSRTVSDTMSTVKS